MTFSRTPAGLSNTHLFYGVDIVVFTEGSEQINEEDIGSHDYFFWGRLFKFFLPELNVKVRCMGSKGSLQQIASDIIDDAAKNIVIAFDRDYDFEIGRQKKHPLIIYTFGYSWENDIWNLHTVFNIIKKHIPIPAVPKHVIENINNAYCGFMAKSRRVAVANLTAKIVSDDCVVPTNSCKALVKKDSKNIMPYFDNIRFRNFLRQFNNKKNKKYYLDKKYFLYPKHHVVGHLLAHFSYNLVLSSFKSLGKRSKIDPDSLNAVAIDIFMNHLKNYNSPCRKYYENCFKGLREYIS